MQTTNFYGVMLVAYQIFTESELKLCLENYTINFHGPEPLARDDRDTLFFLFGDDALALRTYTMKLYSSKGLTKQQRIFNYRISRGRRVVEKSFGILAISSPPCNDAAIA